MCIIGYSMKRIMYWLSRAHVFPFQEQKKCIFKASRKAKMQMFPAPTIAAPTRDTYINSELLTPLFLQTRHEPCILWKDSLKTHANGTIYDRSIISCKKESHFQLHKQSPGGVLLKGVLKICNTIFVDRLWGTTSEWICVITCVGQNGLNLLCTS